MFASLTATLAEYPILVIDGCDGTGKTTLAQALRESHRYAVIHSARTPDGIDLVDRYRQLLANQRIVLDRSFISELVYGPLLHGQSRISVEAAADLARDVAGKGGALVHLTGSPQAIAVRLRHRDGTAPSQNRISAIIDGFHAAFRLLDGTAPVITADTTRMSQLG
jgi:thymidylate kinase